MFERFLNNHVLSNLFFGLVIILGALSYSQMPRQQDPSINFNWISVTVTAPGLAAEDIEKKITNPLEEGLETISDIKFISSSSLEGASRILIRFNDISQAKFATRVSDIRRVINQKTSLLPENANEPFIFEVTSSNAYPSATLVLTGNSLGENLRFHAKEIKREISRMKKVEQVQTNGLQSPEIHIRYFPEELAKHNIKVSDLANNIRSAIDDTAAGDILDDSNKLLVRILGVNKTPQAIAEIPIITSQIELPLSALATVERGRSEFNTLVRYQNKPAVLLTITKKENQNTLKLVEELQEYIASKNKILAANGLRLDMTDDKTEITKNALSIMQNNFLIGLILVLIVTTLLLGTKIAFITTIGIPFTIAGTFILLKAIGFTLNTSVLLGVVIALGMLVDDAVVVVESIYFKLRRGIKNSIAVIEGIKEVFAPVTTSILTTIAAFLPLMLMPGILGKFMLVIPLVVSASLLISLIEAYWLLPSHIMMASMDLSKPNKIQGIRNAALNKMQNLYAKVLLKFLRRPIRSYLFLILLAFTTLIAPISGLIKFNFFASDTLSIFYVNVFMPAGTSVEKTLEKTLEVEKIVQQQLKEHELRSIVSYAGSMFTQTEPLIGQHYGQVQVNLNSQEYSKKNGVPIRDVKSIVTPIRELVKNIENTEKVSILTLQGGPPSSKPISMKFIGNSFSELQAATHDIKLFLQNQTAIRDITDDLVPGSKSIEFRLNYANLREFKTQPKEISNVITSLIDGLRVGTVSINNENVNLLLISQNNLSEESKSSILQRILNTQVTLSNNQLVSINELVDATIVNSKSIIRHYDFSRSITVEANLDKTQTDTVQINRLIAEYWQKINFKYPNIRIDFSGELDDIQESIDSMLILFILGIGLIYLTLGTQFRSYIQPLIVLTVIPMAIIGVIAGLLITGYPLSLYTMYGIVALSGIAVNAAIVMIATANRNTKRGMSKASAIFYAAKRRIIPVTITTLTTIAGLFSLAIGLGGESFIWRPVASTIVFGLLISSILTVLFLPSIYIFSPKLFLHNLFHRYKDKKISQ